MNISKGLAAVALVLAALAILGVGPAVPLLAWAMVALAAALLM